MQESQMSLHDLRNESTTFDPTMTREDFLNQLLSGLHTTVSWPDISAGDDPFDHQSTYLSSKLRHHHTTAAAGALTSSSPLKSFRNDVINGSSFKSPIGDTTTTTDNNNNNTSIQSLFHGLTGSITPNQTQQFRNLSPQNFGSPVTGQVQTASATAGGGGGGGAPSQPRQRVRARRGQATDPHSIAERLRRERIAERMKALQELVPNANKTDKASMLDDIIDYVKFLQLQVKVLSMSRLGGAGGHTVDAEGGGGDCGGDCGQQNGGAVRRSSVGPTSSLNNDTTMATENQVVKLMAEDMGSAMQYLQGKGLCLMPISLATVISTTRCHPNNHLLGGGDGGGPSSLNVSGLTVQSANGVPVKDSP